MTDASSNPANIPIDTDLLRKKTISVLSTLEMALYTYIQSSEHSDEKRLRPSPMSTENKDEQIYFQQVFENFVQCLDTQELRESGKTLLAMAADNELWKIRNACAHVGRDYLACYWYRVASIATHPLLMELDINAPLQAVEAAERNSFAAVEPEWFEAYKAKIPNNLPNSTDYDTTGLIGRKDEKNEINKFIANKRVHALSIIAPGGTGKTALAVDVLRKISEDFYATEAPDGIIFCTFKEEELTTEGIREIEDHDDPQDIRTVLLRETNLVLDTDFESWDDLTEQNEDKKLLILLDNVEKLIIDHESVLTNLELSLPEKWMVLFTSRIDYASGNKIQLPPMREKDALHLARTYAKKRQVDVSEDQLKELTSRCSCNPLAIKLSVDTAAWTDGKISEAVDESVSNIAKYSFENLMDALSDNDIKIFEAINTNPDLTRNSICELLSLTEDEVGKSQRQLKLSSLLETIVVGDENQWRVSESVKHYASTNSRNIQARGEIRERLKARKLKAVELDAENKKSDYPIWDSRYVPVDLSIDLRDMISKAAEFSGSNKHYRDKPHKMKKLSDLYRTFTEKQGPNKNQSHYWTAYAYLSAGLNLSEAENHYRKAIELDSNSLKSRYSFIKYLHAQQDHEKAIELIGESLTVANSLEFAQKEEFVGKLQEELLMIKINCKDFDYVDEHTRSWKDCEPQKRKTLGTIRAAAIKRQAENYHHDPAQAFPYLSRASKTLAHVIRDYGMDRKRASEFFNLANEFGRHYWYDLTDEASRNIASDILQFCETYFDDAETEYGPFKPNEKYSAPTIIEKLSQIQAAAENPFAQLKWQMRISRDVTCGIDISDAEQHYTILTVKKIPRPTENGFRKGFVFMEDQAGNEFFLPKACVIASNETQDKDEAWRNLEVGYAIAMASHNPPEDNRQHPTVSEAYFINT